MTEWGGIRKPPDLFDVSRLATYHKSSNCVPLVWDPPKDSIELNLIDFKRIYCQFIVAYATFKKRHVNVLQWAHGLHNGR